MTTDQNSSPDPLELIKEQIRNCTNCHLHSAHNGPVPGILMKPHGILIVGEAPGHEEDINKMPFVGKSGRYLREKLRQVKLPVAYTSYANMISCRPTGRKNRDPRQDELAACRPNILAQFHAVRPRIVLTVGAISSRLFYRHVHPKYDHGRPVYIRKNQIQIPTYHPAFVLRKKSEWEGVFEADLRKLSLFAYRSDWTNIWPEDCRKCGKVATQFDSFGLAYCDDHYVDSTKPVMQPGMV